MPEVLSQSQIDALLNSMNSGGDKPPAEEEKPEKKYRKYDFTNPKKFTKTIKMPVIYAKTSYFPADT